jgi:1,2-diacylglycerol 3-alpha-glucosyltransferase
VNEWEGRLRIGMFTNVYLPTTNGVVVSVESFRKALTRLGHDVFVFGPDSGDIEDRAPFVFRYPALELPLQKYPMALPVSPYIDHLLKNLKPQVLHANHPALLGRVAAKKSEELKVPLVFTYHTRYVDYSHYADPLPQENVREFIDHWLASFMSNCHHVVVPSESIKQMLSTQYGMSESISVVPTGIELEKFSKYSRSEARQRLGWDDEEFRVVSVGRLAKEKSFDVLLDAFALLDEPRSRLVVVGTGDEEQSLRRRARQLGMAERVHFTGLVKFDDVPLYLAGSDIFAFASVTETQGLVTIEAMASGLPVVAVDASGTREAVCPESSILTKPNAESLAQGLRSMVDRGNLSAAAEASRKRAATFGLLQQGEAMAQAYLRGMEAHSQGRKALVVEADMKSRWQDFLKLFRL